MLEITTAITLLVSALYGSPSVAIAQDMSNSLSTQSKKAIESPVTLEGYIRDYFKETPILAEISRCESMYRQVGEDGEVLRGKVNSDDLGIMQINEYYHSDRAKELMIDLKTLEGNLEYAKYLYNKEGTTPWNSSAKCWK